MNEGCKGQPWKLVIDWMNAYAPQLFPRVSLQILPGL